MQQQREEMRMAQRRRCGLWFGIVLAGWVVGWTSAQAAALRAGAAAIDITPRLGIEINGGTAPVLAQHIHDPLMARALVLESASTRLALVVVDTCLIDRPLLDEAKQLIFRQTGLASNHVSISATHTHSGGSLIGAHLTEPDAEYRAWLPQRLADAVRCAANNLAPAQAGWAKGALPEHVFCRRILVKPDTTYTNLLGQTGDRVKMNWTSPEPAVDGDFSSPVDPEVWVFSLRHADGRPLALLANYSLHYVGGVGPGHLSADYFGVFSRRIEELIAAGPQDPPFVAMLSNGTSGDINNNDYRVRNPPRKPYEQIERVAADLAHEVQRVMATIDYRQDVPISAASAEVSLAYRKPSPAELDAARQIVQGKERLELRAWPQIYAREQLILARYPDEASVPLQVFRIGELAIAQWPGEIFAVSGLDLKQRTPGPLFNISMANGWYGYIPPPEQHALGGYETWRGRTSPLETNAIPKILEGFVRLIERLN